jgi:hypothetical protein
MNTPIKASPESIRQAGYALLRGPREWVERVIDRALDERCSIYHASYLVAVDEAPSWPTCDLCGGAVSPDVYERMPVHYLCKSRQEWGRPTPRIDPDLRCGCTPCRQSAGGGR